jgi:soluble lytic murein transglycosylase
MAAALASGLLEEFGGALAPTIASYNAGEDRVGDWWRAGGSLTPAMFVDLIPYTQTRRYVREVLTNLATYRRLYDASAAF